MNHAIAVAVDASVAVKWVVAEPHTAHALQLWADCAAQHRPVVSAPHFAGEVANAVYQRVRATDPAKHLDFPYADQAVARFLAYSIDLLSPPDLHREAFAFAHMHGLPSLYDALYVVLAHALQVELCTADRRLLGVLSTRAPWVRFIGDYPLPSS